MNKKISLIGALVAGAFLACIAQSALAEEAPNIAAGEKIYKQNRCESCHGNNLQGSAAFPNLLISPKTADKALFTTIVLEGKDAMPSFKANKNDSEGIDKLYAFVSSKRAAATK